MSIKATLSIAYAKNIQKTGSKNILFSPVFYNLYPSRIIMDTDVEYARLVKVAGTFAKLL